KLKPYFTKAKIWFLEFAEKVLSGLEKITKFIPGIAPGISTALARVRSELDQTQAKIDGFNLDSYREAYKAHTSEALKAKEATDELTQSLKGGQITFEEWSKKFEEISSKLELDRYLKDVEIEARLKLKDSFSDFDVLNKLSKDIERTKVLS